MFEYKEEVLNIINSIAENGEKLKCVLGLFWINNLEFKN